MSVPSDQLMELMKGQQAGGPMPDQGGIAGGASPSSPPMSAPMATPEPKQGNKEAAMVNLSMAMDLIEQALPALGSESEHGQKALAALKVLTGILGPKKEKVGALQNTEILQLLQSLPQAGGASPEGKAMAGAAPVPGMSPQGAPGGMPPGMPPGAGGSPQPSPM